MKINKLIGKLDSIRSSRRLSSAASNWEDQEEQEDSSRSKLWRFATSYRENLSPPGFFSDTSGNNNNNTFFRGERLLSCVKFSGGVRKKSPVTVLVGKDRQVFQVEPQILDHGVVQCLIERSGVVDLSRLRAGESPLFEEEITLDCDAILFDHILWLLGRDDPSLRNFNLEELMEFYEFES